MKRYNLEIRTRPTNIKNYYDVVASVVENDNGPLMYYTDHLEAVKQARADALRLVLEHIGKTAPRHIDSRVYSIVDDERARLRAIIEKELSK